MNDKFNTENEDNMEKEKKSKIKKILVNLNISETILLYQINHLNYKSISNDFFDLYL